MRVEVLYRDDPDRGDTDPMPDEASGFRWVHRVYSGDYCDPLFGNWFYPPWPRVLLRWQVKRAHFFAWRIPLGFGWHWMGYAGFKLYGVDSDAYLNWLPDRAVYRGSRAFCLSFRPFSFRRLP